MGNPTLLLQSGGRDSAAAAVNILAGGHRVVGVTLSVDAINNFEIPKLRAQELSQRFTGYRWGMADFTDWEKLFKSSIVRQFSTSLPKSCLLCSLSKITAVIPFCNDNNIKRIALGYTGYQSTWSEQTPYAIELQKKYLGKLGIELVLPSLAFDSKSSVKDYLIANELTPASLENPCCISEWGTQPVLENLVAEAVEAAFDFYSVNTPTIKFVDTIGFEGIVL